MKTWIVETDERTHRVSADEWATASGMLILSTRSGESKEDVALFAANGWSSCVLEESLKNG